MNAIFSIFIHIPSSTDCYPEALASSYISVRSRNYVRRAVRSRLEPKRTTPVNPQLQWLIVSCTKEMYVRLGSAITIYRPECVGKISQAEICGRNSAVLDSPTGYSACCN